MGQNTDEVNLRENGREMAIMSVKCFENFYCSGHTSRQQNTSLRLHLNSKHLEVTLYVLSNNVKDLENIEIKVALFLSRELRDRKAKEILKYS